MLFVDLFFTASLFEKMSCNMLHDMLRHLDLYEQICNFDKFPVSRKLIAEHFLDLFSPGE